MSVNVIVSDNLVISVLIVRKLLLEALRVLHKKVSWKKDPDLVERPAGEGGCLLVSLWMRYCCCCFFVVNECTLCSKKTCDHIFDDKLK